MQIVRLGEDQYTDDRVNERYGFEADSRAFAYDPANNTIYTHTGHHPNIVEWLYNNGDDMYNDPELVTEDRQDMFVRASEDYL